LAISSAASPARRRPQPISMHEPACQPVTVAPSLTGGARLSAPSPPSNSSPLLRARGNAGRIAANEPATRHHPAPQGWTHVCLSPCVIVSAVMRRGISSPLPRSISSLLPRSIPSPGACRRGRLAASSPTRAAGSPYPLVHRGVASPYCASRPLSSRGAATMLTPSTSRHGLVQRLCFLLPYWHRGRASSRSPPRCLGTRRHRALACLCVPRGHGRTLLVQLTVPTPAYRQNSHPTLALHDARCRCASAPRERTPALSPCQAVPSHARTCCHPWCPIRPPVARVYKAPSPLHIVCPPPSVGPQVSLCQPPYPLPLRPPWRLLLIASPSFLAGPGAPQGPGAAPRPAQPLLPRR
jgi:hypothetical protein